MVTLPIGLVARVALRVHEFEVPVLPEPQSKLLDPVGDDGGTANQDRLRDTVIDHDLRRAQHPRVFAFGEHQTLRFRPRPLDHRFHQHAGAEHEPLQPVAVGLEIFDRARRHAAVHRGPGHRRRDLDDQAQIERFRDHVFRAEFQILALVGNGDDLGAFRHRQSRDRLHRRLLHLLVDLRRADIQRAAENERKA